MNIEDITEEQKDRLFNPQHCPNCASESWRRRKTDKKFVCLKCGEEYEIITSDTN